MCEEMLRLADEKLVYEALHRSLWWEAGAKWR